MHQLAASQKRERQSANGCLPGDRTGTYPAATQPWVGNVDRTIAHATQRGAYHAGSITIRHAGPDDFARLAQFYRDLSPRSRHRRFLGVVNELPAALVRRFVEASGADGTTLLVIAQGVDGREVVIGEARYAPTRRPRNAEFALAIADGAQGRGIGRCLLQALLRHAAADGIGTLQGDVLPDNQPMLALAHALGFDERRDPNDPRLRLVERRIEAPAEAEAHI